MIILSVSQYFTGMAPGIIQFFSLQNAGRIAVAILLVVFMIFSIWKTWRIVIDMDKSDRKGDD
jgi:hypothetical protein